MTRVMITCVGGELMPYTIKYLKNIKNIKLTIIGTDNDINATGKFFCDKFYAVPKGNHKSYISKCIDIVKREKVELIIPTSDEEAMALSKKKNLFNEKNVTIACIDYSTLKIINDKSKTYSRLAKAGIQVAKWDKIKSEKLLIEKLHIYFEKYGGAVVKPTSGRGSRNIFIISKNKNKYVDNKNITKLDRIKDFYPILKKNNFLNNFIIMQELYEPVVDIDLLSWRGNPISIVPRKRVVINVVIPTGLNP